MRGKKENIMRKRIFLSAPHMGGNEQEYIGEVFKSNYIAPLGAFVERFEADIKAYTKAKAALALSSGTAALHLALRVLGIGKGDEVLASTFTFIGSVNAILYEGATPVFIDSDKKSWNLSPELLEEYLRTCKVLPKALIVTHLYGQMCDIEKIASLCKEYGIYLIEDAAESLGATCRGQQSGTFGDFGIFSFNGNKIITTSGGGMLVSNNEAWIAKAKFYSTQAKEPFLHYEHNEYGYNYRMSNVLAAIGVGQMEVLQTRVEQKRQIFEWYKEGLKSIESVEWMPELPNTKGNRWLSTFACRGMKPLLLVEALEKINVESRPLWKPMHAQPLFKDTPRLVDGTSEWLFENGICLPSSTTMSKGDVEEICSVIKGVIG